MILPPVRRLAPEPLPEHESPAAPAQSGIHRKAPARGDDRSMRMKIPGANIKLGKNAVTGNATGLATDAFQETCNDDAH
jgi:hypothetical protein